MKRLIPLLLACVLLLSGCKPDGIDDQTYDLGKRAIEIAEDYLDAKTTLKETREKLDFIQERLDGLEFDKETQHDQDYHNFMVALNVLDFQICLTSDDPNKLYKSVKELKKYLGIK